MIKYLLCWLLFGFAVCLQAQQATPAASASPASTPAGPPPTLPPGPLMKPVPDRTSWLVTITEKSAPNASNQPANGKPAEVPKPRTITGQKVLPVVHVSTTTDNGKEECWSDGKTMVTTNTAWKVPLFATGAPEEFPRPTWISRKNIKEIRKQGDREFWVFRDRIFPGGEVITKDMLLPGENPEDLKVDAVAVIDAQTRLPVGVQSGSEVTTYKFEPIPPTTTLDLPADLQAMIAERLQKVQASTRRAVRP